MMRSALICVAAILTAGFSQDQYVKQDDDIRLSPRVLNYQGYLTDDQWIPITNPSVSMTFSIYDALTSGNLKWSETQTSVDVNKGVFSVILGSGTPIPDSVFIGGTDRWLELTVDGQTLTPRTRITSAGYAYTSTYSDTAEYARNAATDGDWVIVVNDQYSGVSGNVGIGTSSPAYKLHVNGVINGGYNNQIQGPYGVTPGGYMNDAGDSEYDSMTVVAGGKMNTVGEKYGAIAGGFGNTAAGTYNFIGGGRANNTDNEGSTIAGGLINTASGQYCAVLGGQGNTVSGSAALIGGGQLNTADQWYSIVVGGYNNYACGYSGMIGGGYQNYVDGMYSVISNGYADSIKYGADYSYLFGINSDLTQDSTFMVDLPHVWFGTETNGYEFPRQRGTNGQIMITDGSGGLNWFDIPDQSKWSVTDSVLHTNCYWGLARGGADNKLYGTLTGTQVFTHTNIGGYACTTGTSGQDYQYITIAGGRHNRAQKSYTFIGGGMDNRAAEDFATIVAGDSNQALGLHSAVVAGYRNYAGTDYNDTASTIVGGFQNSINTSFSFIGGGYSNEINNAGIHAVIGGGHDNTVSYMYNALLGGYHNNAGNNYSCLVGGYDNANTSQYAFLGGGYRNYNQGDYSAVVGGYADTITSTGDFSYLFGINSNLTQDSTFMVDLPHVWFGTETNGYEFPRQRGTNGQIMITDGSGGLNWSDIPDQSKWSVTDSVLHTNVRWGLARGGTSTTQLYGTTKWSHTNFGAYACTTGTDGQNNSYITICGGYGNCADSSDATVVGGSTNKARGMYSFVGGGQNNTVHGRYAGVACGRYQTADAFQSFIGGGYSNHAGGTYSAILGGFADTISTGANYSYLFGINSNLTQDSTFMVDMPHIRFGTEGAGYEFPKTDGASGQVMITDGSGQLFWAAPPFSTGSAPDDSLNIMAFDMAGAALNSIQELSRTVEEQRTMIESQQKIIDDLSVRVSELESR